MDDVIILGHISGDKIIAVAAKSENASE